MAKKTSYTGKSATELAQTESQLRKEIFDLKFQHATRALQSPALITSKRRELARVLTAMTSAQQNLRHGPG